MRNPIKNISAILICLLLLVAGCKSVDESDGGDADALIPEAGPENYTATAYAAEFKMWEHFKKPFADADKTDQGDTNLCWAAAAANVLAWSDWAADEDDTFNIFKKHFDDDSGYIYDALNFYFNNYVYGVGADMVTVKESRSHMLLDFIVSTAHDGKGIIAKIAYPGKKISHFITIWGYRYFPEDDNFGLFFSDSDDHVHSIRYCDATWNDTAGRWEMDGLHPNSFLEYIVALAPN
jgi:hypothetical protein